MFNRRVLIEIGFLAFPLSIIGLTIYNWNSLNCQLPLNIWFLIFSIILLISHILFLILALAHDNIQAFANTFFLIILILNPLILLWNLVGISFYIVYLIEDDYCGSFYYIWIFLLCLVLSAISIIITVYQCCQIYKSNFQNRDNIIDLDIQFPISNRFIDSMNLTDEELSRIPAFKASGEIVNTECSICHEKVLVDDFLRKLPGCAHAFHQNCIDGWLRQSQTCPLCRNNVNMGFK
ncbi:hypothetical protein SteCoe_22387 [Stentor coeruleus]|uniref:RING-type domain-containing protein n=1 Tax=Stentor coeruleus TaxID=5963 RepID=A0A1R2BMB1_9CILI|nr:hypothetical protein SteCoe_22387 [Stentor coeruleus]